LKKFPTPKEDKYLIKHYDSLMNILSPMDWVRDKGKEIKDTSIKFPDKKYKLKEDKKSIFAGYGADKNVANIYLNPSAEEMKELHDRVGPGNVRYTAFNSGENHYFYIWDADEALHDEVVHKLGLPRKHIVGYAYFHNGALFTNNPLLSVGTDFEDANIKSKEWSWIKEYFPNLKLENTNKYNVRKLIEDKITKHFKSRYNTSAEPTYYINPTKEELIDLYNSRTYVGENEFRFIAWMPSGKKYLFIWDATKAIHREIMDLAGINFYKQKDYLHGFAYINSNGNIKFEYQYLTPKWSWLKQYSK
jgi:hypothetical protein